MRTLFAMFVAGLLLLAVPERNAQAAAATRAGALAGVCVDSQRNPVAGAQVVLKDASGQTWSTTTDRAGRFGFRMLRPGRYVVGAAKRGVGKDREQVAILPGQTARVRLVLQ